MRPLKLSFKELGTLLSHTGFENKPIHVGDIVIHTVYNRVLSKAVVVNMTKTKVVIVPPVHFCRLAARSCFTQDGGWFVAETLYGSQLYVTNEPLSQYPDAVRWFK
jgi:hypothetical protein